VINRSDRECLPVASVVAPNYETAVVPVCREGEAPRRPPMACGDYIVSRYDTSFAYRSKAGKHQAMFGEARTPARPNSRSPGLRDRETCRHEGMPPGPPPTDW